MTIWIGLVGVTPLAGNTCLEGAKGAYVNAIAQADTVEQYKEAVTASLEDLALCPFEFEDMEPFTARAAREQLEEHLLALAEEARQSAAVQFGNFHTYSEADE
jgi:hypothetical protein